MRTVRGALKNPVVTGVAGMAVMGMAVTGVANAGDDRGKSDDGWHKHHDNLLRSSKVYLQRGDVKEFSTHKGRVQSIDDSSIRVRSRDGFERTYRLRQASDFDFCTKREKVATGDLVKVYAKQKNDGPAVARLVDQLTDENVKGHKKAGHRHHDGRDHRKGDRDRHGERDKGRR